MEFLGKVSKKNIKVKKQLILNNELLFLPQAEHKTTLVTKAVVYHYIKK